MIRSSPTGGRFADGCTQPILRRIGPAPTPASSVLDLGWVEALPDEPGDRFLFVAAVAHSTIVRLRHRPLG